MSDTEAAATPTGNTSPTSEANSSEPSSAHASPAKAKDKIDVLLKATGNAPIMKKRKWGVERNKKIAAINEFVRKYIKSEPHESLFLYVNQAFAPSPDVDIGTLYDCFGSDGKLVLHYALSEAWG